MLFVYILKCADGTLYTGYTKDVRRRLHEHNALKKGAHYTTARRPVALMHTEPHATLGEALKREAEIKRWTRQRKLKLIRTKPHGFVA